MLALQPYGSLFFASAPIFDKALPAVTEVSENSVVILRLRGKTDMGTTLMEILERYAVKLRHVNSRLMIVSASDRIVEQLRVTGVANVIGEENIYPSDEWVGETLQRAYDDAAVWVEGNSTS